MKLDIKLNGRPRKECPEDIRERANRLMMVATDLEDSCILSAIYQAITTDNFPALSRSLTAAGHKLCLAREKRLKSYWKTIDKAKGKVSDE